MSRLFMPYGEDKVVTFPSGYNQNWICPPGVTSIKEAKGVGARGSAGSSGGYRWQKVTVNVEYLVGGEQRRTYAYGEYLYYDVPADSCGPRIPVNTGSVTHVQSCTIYVQEDYGSSSPPTTGASSTGFSKTFPGSYGGATPVPTTFTNIPTVPGTPYPIRVASGGYITITYTE